MTDYYQLITAVFSIWLCSHLARALWNVSPFHPLSHIPGPKLAAASYLPEMYYDIVCVGRYTSRIAELHERYGPIIRISPHELHCSDPLFADTIYHGGGGRAAVRHRDPHAVSGSGLVGATFVTADHAQHRVRRAPLARFFSRARIAAGLESRVAHYAGVLCDRLLEQRAAAAGNSSSPEGKEEDKDGEEEEEEPTTTTTTIELVSAFSCFTTDVITEYCFGAPFGHLEHPRLVSEYRLALWSLLRTTHLFRFFPVLERLSLLVSSFTSLLPAEVALLVRTRTVDMPRQITETRRALECRPDADADPGPDTQNHSTVFASLLSAPHLPPAEKSVERLTGEALSVVGGATETTSWTLSVVTFYLLSRPEVLERLTREIEDAAAGAAGAWQTDDDDDDDNNKKEEEAGDGGPGQQGGGGAGAEKQRAKQQRRVRIPSWNQLEKLPYMSAVIQEGLRLSYGGGTRLARIAPDEDLVYQRGRNGAGGGGGRGGGEDTGLLIPRGTAIGMSIPITHHDERFFPDSRAFVPERWLRGEEQKERGKHDVASPETAFMAFSRGGRTCLGMNLAFCELYITLASLVLRGVLPRMQLFDTTEENDIRYYREMVLPLPKGGSSKGVLVKIR